MLTISNCKGLVLVVCLTLVALAGCDKEVKLTFFNGTSQNRDVILIGPGDGTGYLGSVGSMSKLKTRIKVDEDFLPADYEWEAGEMEGKFTITKDSSGKLMIVLDRSGSTGPIDKRTEIQKTEVIKLQDVVIDQGTIVE